MSWTIPASSTFMQQWIRIVLDHVQLNTLFSGMGAIIFVMYMNEVDVYIPPWVWYFSVRTERQIHL